MIEPLQRLSSRRRIGLSVGLILVVLALALAGFALRGLV